MKGRLDGEGRRRSLGAVTTHGRVGRVKEDGRMRQVHPGDLRTVVRCRRDHTGWEFKVLAERTAVDYPEDEARFEVVYQRRSVRRAARVTVKVRNRKV
jgi:NADH:ubiquinone oxidoreductase subunit C